MTGRALRRLLGLAGPWRATLAVAVVAGTLTVATAVGLMAASGFLVAKAAEHPNEAALAVAVVAVRACGVGRGFFRYVERLASHDAAFRVLADLRARVYDRLTALAPAGLGGFRRGDLLSRLVSDVDAVQDLFVRGLTPLLVALVVGVGVALAVTLASAPAGAVLAAGLVAAAVLVPWVAGRANRRAGERLAPVRGRLAGEVTDTVSGAADLVAFGATERAVSRLADSDAELRGLARRTARATGAGTGLQVFVAGATVWALLVTGVAAVGRGTLSPVLLAVLVLAGLSAFEATNPLLAVGTELAGVRASARRLFAVLDAPDPVVTPDRPRPLPDGPVHLRLTGVGMRYTPDGPWALRGLDLDLPPGRRVAVVGPSGAGKSSIVNVLLRFHDVQEGSVTLNGVPLAELDPDDVRRVVGGCPADPHVFDSTVRENLRLARPAATDDELADAARRAHLLAWVERLPRGWDTPVGPNGAALSGGERQRLALARALLADPQVVVLDEPTAHLDPETAAALRVDLLEATAGRTTLWITHDRGELDAFDEVVELDGTSAPNGVHRPREA